MPEKLYTEQLKTILPKIFDTQKAFVGFTAPTQVVDGITFTTKAFTVKRNNQKAVINNYDKDKDLNSLNGGSRFGKINEIVYQDIDVDYEYDDAINEGLDRAKVNENLDQAVADRMEQQGIAMTDISNKRIGLKLSQNANKVLTLGSSFTPEDIDTLFANAKNYLFNKKVSVDLVAAVTSTVFSALQKYIQTKSLTGTVVDINNSTLLKYQGFTIEETPDDYFVAGEVAYFGASQIVTPFVGIEFEQSMPSSQFGGQVLLGYTKSGNYLAEEYQDAIAKAVIDTTVHVGSVVYDQQSATVKVGATNQVIARVVPANAADKSLTYKSSDDKIATVSTDGTITGVKVGKAIITATSNDGSKTANLTVTVNAA